MQESSGDSVGLIVWLAVIVVTLIALWRTFEKANRPGWNAIIPIYNIYIILKIVSRPGWWLVWYFIPIANIIVHLLVSLRLAKSFKRSEAFGIVFLWLFPIIGFLILGFGSSKYAKLSAK